MRDERGGGCYDGEVGCDSQVDGITITTETDK